MEKGNSFVCRQFLYGNPEPPCVKIYLGDNKIDFFHFLLGVLNRHEGKKWAFSESPGPKFLKTRTVSIRFDLREKSEQLAWTRV